MNKRSGKPCSNDCPPRPPGDAKVCGRNAGSKLVGRALFIGTLGKLDSERTVHSVVLRPGLGEQRCKSERLGRARVLARPRPLEERVSGVLQVFQAKGRALLPLIGTTAIWVLWRFHAGVAGLDLALRPRQVSHPP